MKINQRKIDSDKINDNFSISENADLVFIFGPQDAFNDSLTNLIKNAKVNAKVVGCSTAGEIHQEGVAENSIILNEIKFDKGSKVKTTHVNLDLGYESIGKKIFSELNSKDLKGIVLLSPGLNVNGSSLVNAVKGNFDSKLPITGGLAGDYGKFESTSTLCGDIISESNVVAIGFYGDSVQLKNGSQGGWKPFGPIRQATKFKDNILFEIDGNPALDVYKKYLGEHAKNLPASGLLFPLEVLSDEENTSGIIRTILAVDEINGSLTLAGDLSEGSYLRLMHADNDSLIDGAETAANNIECNDEEESFGLLVSCVGRKLVLTNEVDEEVLVIKDKFGKKSTVSGFYSFGEICPKDSDEQSKLHNQTMTITYITEAA